MLSVVHLIPCDAIGGVETAARSMAMATNLRCEIGIKFIGRKVCIETKRSLSISPTLTENNIFAHFRALISILSNMPDVLICSLWRSVPIGIMVKLIKPEVKLVYFLHSSDATHIVEKLLNWLIMRICDAVWTDSRTTLLSRSVSKRVGIKRVISFVTSSVAIPRELNHLAPRFIFWGRLNRCKGLDRSINFIAMMIARGCDASLDIWGPDDGEGSSLKKLVKEKGIEKAVFFRGPVAQEELISIAGQNTFFLQFSRQEGMAMAVVEAMQRALVPVVTPVGEIGVYCKHGENSIVVDDPYNPTAAVEEVISLLEDEPKYRQMQSASVGVWNKCKLYQDDVCDAAHGLFEL